ncbi:hypothetical protein ACFTY8_20625 [Streptomyces mirabilis]
MFFAEPGTPDHDAIVLLDLLGQEPASEGAAPGSGPTAATPDGDESRSS